MLQASTSKSVATPLEKISEHLYYSDTLVLTPDGQLFPLSKFILNPLYADEALPLLLRKSDALSTEKLKDKIKTYLDAKHQNYQKVLTKITERWLMLYTIGVMNASKSKAYARRLERIRGYIYTILDIDPGSRAAQSLKQLLNDQENFDSPDSIQKCARALARLHQDEPYDLEALTRKASILLRELTAVPENRKTEILETLAQMVAAYNIPDTLAFILQQEPNFRIILFTTKQEFNHFLGFHVDKDLEWGVNDLSVSNGPSQYIALPLALNAEGSLQHPLPKPWLFGGTVYTDNEHAADLPEHQEKRNTFVSLFAEELRDHATNLMRSMPEATHLLKIEPIRAWQRSFLRQTYTRLRTLALKVIAGQPLQRDEQTEWKIIQQLVQDYPTHFQASARTFFHAVTSEMVKPGGVLTLADLGAIGAQNLPLQVQEVRAHPKLKHLKFAVLAAAPITTFNDHSKAELILQFLADLQEVFVITEHAYSPEQMSTEYYGRIVYFQLAFPGLAERYLEGLLQQLAPIDHFISQIAAESRRISQAAVKCVDAECYQDQAHHAGIALGFGSQTARLILAGVHSSLISVDTDPVHPDKNAASPSEFPWPALPDISGTLMLGLVLCYYLYQTAAWFGLNKHNTITATETDTPLLLLPAEEEVKQRCKAIHERISELEQDFTCLKKSPPTDPTLLNWLQAGIEDFSEHLCYIETASTVTKMMLSELEQDLSTFEAELEQEMCLAKLIPGAKSILPNIETHTHESVTAAPFLAQTSCLPSTNASSLYLPD